MVELVREALHTSVTDPVAASMNFLNEVASRFPAAISLAAGRPFDEFYDVEDAERYLAAYIGHLRGAGMDEGRVRQAILQYGRTNGQLGTMIARMLEIDEGIRVPPEAVMVTSGCQEAMIIALRGLCADSRDVVLAAEPCYLGFTGAARVLGVTVVPYRRRRRACARKRSRRSPARYAPAAAGPGRCTWYPTSPTPRASR